MITRVQTTALVFVTVTSVAVSLLFAGEPLSFTWLGAFTVAETITFLAIIFFNRWVWKRRYLQGWFVRRPLLEGDWKFTINPTRVYPETENTPDEIIADVKIKQTYTKLHMQLETPESRGNLISANIVEKDDGTYQIMGVFRNEPFIHLQDQSRIHIGALLLNVIGDSFKPKNMVGHYWTDRSTKGRINGSRITSPE